MIDFTPIIPAADREGDFLVAKMRENLDSANANATRRTRNSLRSETQVDRGRVRVSIFGKDTSRFTDQGRGPGKRPPIEPIRVWVLAKGLTNDPQEAGGIAFAVARKIGREGTNKPPSEFATKVIQNDLPRSAARLRGAVLQELFRILPALLRQGAGFNPQ